MCRFWLAFLFFSYCGSSGLAASLESSYECDYCQPEQIHIAFGEQSSDIVVTWSTFNDTGESLVRYWSEAGSVSEAAGRQTRFQDGGVERRIQYIHRVRLARLVPGTTYTYVVGSRFGWSETLRFVSARAYNSSDPVRLALYGDMGNENAQSLGALQLEAAAGTLDAVLHVGDFAYDMDSQNAEVGDQFMRQLQPLAATVPYMVCVGNHEEAYNFSNYRARFSMPGHENSEGLWYSWTLGPVQFIAISTELYYFTHYGLAPLYRQHEWLRRELQRASSPKNRSARPWIVVYGHRPMYCSNGDDAEECEHELTRAGLPVIGMGMENLLVEFGVDLVVWAHEHSYERTWPLYNYTVYNGTHEPYTNPRAPVHVVTGSAGCKERNDNFVLNPPAWSAFRSSDYGYSRMKVFNHTHLYFEQVDVDLNGQVIDSFWLVKERHEPYHFEHRDCMTPYTEAPRSLSHLTLNALHK